MSILSAARNETAATAVNNAAAQTPAADRPKSEMWINVGVVLKGAGEDGEDIFVSLPKGIPLDDLVATDARGNNIKMIHLTQAKNALLAAVQKKASQLDPGTRETLSELTVEVYRSGKPESTGTVENNPLIAAMSKQLG